jgi:sulfite exporter TauE/SafE
MCGPLAGFAGRSGAGALRYHLGRILSYGGLGAFAGYAGASVTDVLSEGWATALVSWSLAFALAYAAWRLWHGTAPARVGLVQVGTGPTLPSLGDRALSALPREPLVIGLVTALLPCGALWAAVLVAAGFGHVGLGVVAMLGFGLTSGLSLVGVAWVGRRMLAVRRPNVLRVLSALLLVGAVVLVVRPITVMLGEEPACCEAMAD